MTELYFTGQQNPTIETYIFYQQVLQDGLIDRPGQGLQTSIYVLIFEIFMEIIGGC